MSALSTNNSALPISESKEIGSETIVKEEEKLKDLLSKLKEKAAAVIDLDTIPISKTIRGNLCLE